MEFNDNLLASITLYDTVIAKFRQGFDEKSQKKLVEESQIEKLEEIIEKKIPTSSQPQRTDELPKTGILDDLYDTVNRATEDYKISTINHFTGDHVTDYVSRKNKEDFYETRMGYWASEIMKLIEGLIRWDYYPQTLFGNYQTLKEIVDLCDGEKSASAFRELLICAKSVIPPEIKFARTEIIEPTISNLSITFFIWVIKHYPNIIKSLK